MHWIYLSLAILFEISGTTCLKLSAGFSKWVPAVLMVLFYCVSFYCLGKALKNLDVSVAYAIWAGIGTALISAIGVLYFREPMTALKFIGTVAIVGGVIVLNMSGGAN